MVVQSLVGILLVLLLACAIWVFCHVTQQPPFNEAVP